MVNLFFMASGRNGGGRRYAFLRDRSGAAALEFAIVALPLLAFVALIFHVALYHFALQSLDHATRIAARSVMVGKAQVNATSEAAFKSGLLCPRFILGFTCEKVVVNAFKVEATSDAAAGTGIYKFIDAATKSYKTSPSGTSFCLGGPSDYVLLDVSYDFPNLFGSALSSDGAAAKPWTLRSTSFFRNEPFATKGAAC